MKKWICLLFLFPQLLYAQDYVKYQQIFNRVDEDILVDGYAKAVKRFDTVYKNYSFIYANHCIKALQMCCLLDDTARANIWLQKSFLQGIPMNVIRVNGLTSKVFNYTSSFPILVSYDSLRAVYKASYNQNVARTINGLIAKDQRLTRKVNDGFILWRYSWYWPRWVFNNKKQFKTIHRIIKTYGYPGERLIGLSTDYEDTAWVRKSFTKLGPNVFERRVQTMMMHFYSNPRKDINDELLPNVKSGYLEAKQYGVINDFLAEYDKSRHGYYIHYRTWFKESTRDPIDKVNAARRSIGLNTVEQQQRNYAIAKDRIESKTANDAIIME